MKSSSTHIISVWFYKRDRASGEMLMIGGVKTDRKTGAAMLVFDKRHFGIQRRQPLICHWMKASHDGALQRFYGVPNQEIFYVGHLGDVPQPVPQMSSQGSASDYRRKAYERAQVRRASIPSSTLWLEFESLTGYAGPDLQEAKTAYRKAALKYHPDRGGSADTMARLNAVWDKLTR